jgi:uncharacterized protein (TIGR02145 family)
MKRETRIRFIPLMLIGISLMLSNSCKKEVKYDIYDIDGNGYYTVTIGTQVWMAENLKTTKYRDGTAIPNVTDGTTWGGLTTGAYCWYDNDIANKDEYGALYNWYTVNTGKLCPTGWNVPTKSGWTILTDYLGGAYITAGRDMKETGHTHWSCLSPIATNSSGFTGLPGGYRSDDYFDTIGNAGDWWSSTEYNTTEAWILDMDCDVSYVSIASFNKSYGFSVRCIKD